MRETLSRISAGNSSRQILLYAKGGVWLLAWPQTGELMMDALCAFNNLLNYQTMERIVHYGSRGLGSRDHRILALIVFALLYHNVGGRH